MISYDSIAWYCMLLRCWLRRAGCVSQDACILHLLWRKTKQRKQLGIDGTSFNLVDSVRSSDTMSLAWVVFQCCAADASELWSKVGRVARLASGSAPFFSAARRLFGGTTNLRFLSTQCGTHLKTIFNHQPFQVEQHCICIILYLYQPRRKRSDNVQMIC